MSEELSLITEEKKKAEKKRLRKKRWRLVRRILFSIIAVAVLALIILLVYGQIKADNTVTYDQYSASTGTISNALSFSGSLQVTNSATYGASEQAVVKNVYVSEDDPVKKGDRLIRLSSGEVITAGFDGTVNQVLVKEGDSVALNTSLVQIADFSRMLVSIRVDEYDISDIRTGQTCRVTVTATEQTFETTIASINHISSSSSTVAYYTATAYVDVTDGHYPGMQVTVSIPQEEAKDVVVLKVDALSFDETNQAYVLMPDETGVMQSVYVTTGVSNGNYVEITSGLASGDTVYKVAEKTERSTNFFASLFNLGGGQQTRQNNGTQQGTPQNRQNNMQNRNNQPSDLVTNTQVNTPTQRTPKNRQNTNPGGK